MWGDLSPLLNHLMDLQQTGKHGYPVRESMGSLIGRMLTSKACSILVASKVNRTFCYSSPEESYVLCISLQGRLGTGDMAG